MDDDGDGSRPPEESKRVRRLLQIITLLTNQPRQWKRAGLATHLEVSERGIDRDLQVLRAVGYGVERATGGGYYFERVPAVLPVSFSLPEVLALTLAAGLARDSDVDTGSLGTALVRLEDLMPLSARPLVRQELLLRQAGARANDRLRLALQVVQRAWLERRRLRIVYETGMRGGAISERIIEPYHLERHGRFWIVTAYDHLRGMVRDFKLDRLHQAVLLDEGYTIPDGFDITVYRGAIWGLLRGEATDPTDVALLFTARAARWAQEEDRGIPLTVEPQPDGRVLIRLRAGITDEMVRWLLGFGPDCTVLQPADLRARVREMAEETLRLYNENTTQE